MLSIPPLIQHHQPSSKGRDAAARSRRGWTGGAGNVGGEKLFDRAPGPGLGQKINK